MRRVLSARRSHEAPAALFAALSRYTGSAASLVWCAELVLASEGYSRPGQDGGVPRRREASHAPRTRNPRIPKGCTFVRPTCSESSCSLSKMRRAEAKAPSALPLSTREPTRRRSLSESLHTCVWWHPPPKKTVSRSKKVARRLMRPQAQSDSPASRPRELQQGCHIMIIICAYHMTLYSIYANF